MAIQRGQSLTRGSKSTKVTNQFGVVRSQASGFGEALGNVAEAATKFTQFQADIIDQNWKTDFKTKTLEFYTDLENKYLNSPQPDFNALKAEVDGYKSSLLNKAPKRFENLVKNYTDQNSIDVFDKVKNYSNKLLFKQTKDNLFIDIQNVQNQTAKNIRALDDVYFDSADFQNSGLNKQEAINLAIGRATFDITDISEKMTTLKNIEPLSFGEYEESVLLNELFANLEQQRVLAITSSFYDDVNFADPNSVDNADLNLDKFLLNYEEGNTFRASENLNETDVNKIITEAKSRQRDILSINKDIIKESERQIKNNFDKNVLNLIDTTGDLNNNKEDTFGYLRNKNGEIISIDELLNYSIDGENFMSVEEATKIRKNMIYKEQINEVYDKYDSGMGTTLSQMFSDPELEDAKEHFGNTKKLINNYVKNKFSNINNEFLKEKLLNGSWKTDKEIETYINFQLTEGVITDQFSSIINDYDLNKLETIFFDKSDNRNTDVELWEATYGMWKLMTKNGSVSIEGIDKDVDSLFTDAASFEKEFDVNAYTLIDRIVKNKRLVEEQKVKNNNSSGSVGNIATYSNVTEYFENKDISQSDFFKAYYDKQISVYLENLGDVKQGYLGSPKETEITKDIKNYLKVNKDYFKINETKILEQIKKEVNDNAHGGESQERLDDMFSIYAVKVLDKWGKSEYRGPTAFAENGFGEMAIVPHAFEIHNSVDGKPLDKNSADVMVFAYVKEALKQGYDDSVGAEQLRNTFTINGEAPLFGAEAYGMDDDKLFQFITEGGVELEYVGGKGKNAKYQIRFNMGASNVFDANQYDGDQLLLNVDGNLFSGSLYETNFLQVKNNVVQEIVNKYNNKADDPVFNQATGGLYEYLNIGGLVTKIVEFGENIGFDVGSDSETLKSSGLFNLMGQREMSFLEKELYKDIAEEYNLQQNNAAVKFVKEKQLGVEYLDSNIMNLSKDLNRQMNFWNPLNKNKMFKTEDEYISATESLYDNVNNFNNYDKFEQSMLLDAVVNFNPDMTDLRKFLMNGNVDMLSNIFPDMNSYNIKIIGELFGFKK